MNLTGVPTTQTFTTTGGLQCVFGQVVLFQFIVRPQPGTIIGEIRPISGSPIPLVQLQVRDSSLQNVNGQFATLCGRFVRVQNRTALDVVLVNPFVPTPIPQPVDNRLLLLLLLLLLLRSGSLGQLGGLNLSSLAGLGGLGGLGGLNLSSLAGLNINPAALGNIAGLSNVNINALLQQLSATQGTI